jgi:hypothetical protein
MNRHCSNRSKVTVATVATGVVTSSHPLLLDIKHNLHLVYKKRHNLYIIYEIKHNLHLITYIKFI